MTALQPATCDLNPPGITSGASSTVTVVLKLPLALRLKLSECLFLHVVPASLKKGLRGDPSTHTKGQMSSLMFSTFCRAAVKTPAVVNKRWRPSRYFCSLVVPTDKLRLKFRTSVTADDS